ncbi:MAG: hypothetical protein ACRCUY_10740 [Thermoguttaceae bacterium]
MSVHIPPLPFTQSKSRVSYNITLQTSGNYRKFEAILRGKAICVALFRLH